MVYIGPTILCDRLLLRFRLLSCFRILSVYPEFLDLLFRFVLFVFSFLIALCPARLVVVVGNLAYLVSYRSLFGD